MATIQLINGPNLNMLGVREPDKYGSRTLAHINAELSELANQRHHQLQCVQSNAESELIEHVHASLNHVDYILINPGAFTHTSVALRDALLAVSVPFIEIHLTNVHSRETFRQHSYLSDIAIGVITGFGAEGYQMALTWAMDQIDAKASQ